MLNSVPVLQLLIDFAAEKLDRAHISRDPIVIARTLRDLHDALKYLAGAHPEFEKLYNESVAGMASLARVSRQRLVHDFLSTSTPPEDLHLISETLAEIIQRGGWENWENEFDQAVEAARLRNHRAAS